MIVLPNGDQDINGIIHQIPGLPVSCTSSSRAETISDCQNAITPSHNYHFCANRDELNAWMTFTLGSYDVYLTNYSVQAPFYQDLKAPVNWTFHGQKGNEWILMDDVIDSGLFGSLKIITRTTNIFGPFSSFRISMNGLNYDSLPAFRIYKIDLFGFISNSTNQFFTQMSSCHNQYSYFKSLFILLFSSS